LQWSLYNILNRTEPQSKFKFDRNPSANPSDFRKHTEIRRIRIRNQTPSHAYYDYHSTATPSIRHPLYFLSYVTRSQWRNTSVTHWPIYCLCLGATA